MQEAPDAPAPAKALPADPDASQVATYAMDAVRLDQELAKYRYNLIAAKANAASLWTDLRTAGRIPDWPDAAINGQEKAYADIAAKAESIEAQRSASRAAARKVVDNWNATHGDAEPIPLEFGETS